MHFALTDDQRFLQRTTADFCARELDDSVLRGACADGGALRVAAWKKLAELGLVGLLVPEDRGGGGGSVTDACAVAEVLGRHLAPVPFVGTAIAAAALLRFGGGADQALADLARGDAFSVLLGRHLEEPVAEATVAFDWTAGARGVVLTPVGPPVCTNWSIRRRSRTSTRCTRSGASIPSRWVPR